MPLFFCEFNTDTACVELKNSDGTMLSIDTIAVVNEFAETWLDRRELDDLIYNDPWGYADLVLDGDVKSIWILSDTDSDNEGVRYSPYCTLFTALCAKRTSLLLIALNKSGVFD